MNKAPNIVTRPNMRHNMRFVSQEKRRKVQYDMDKRREEQGKTVIHLHEQPPKPKLWPYQEEMQRLILAHYEDHLSLPERVIVPFRSCAPLMGYVVHGLPKDSVWDLKTGGRLVEMRVTYDPNAPGVRVA